MQMMVYSFFDEGSGDVTFCSNEMGFLSVSISNINPDTIILILALHSKFKKRKAVKNR